MISFCSSGSKLSAQQNAAFRASGCDEKWLSSLKLRSKMAKLQLPISQSQSPGSAHGWTGISSVCARKLQSAKSRLWTVSRSSFLLCFTFDRSEKKNSTHLKILLRPMKRLSGMRIRDLILLQSVALRTFLLLTLVMRNFDWQLCLQQRQMAPSAFHSFWWTESAHCQIWSGTSRTTYA